MDMIMITCNSITVIIVIGPNLGYTCTCTCTCMFSPFGVHYVSKSHDNMQYE